jgi:hypothetical protein
LFPALLHGDRELDATNLKRNLERVGVTRVQVGSDQVKLPVITSLMKGNVGNIRNALWFTSSTVLRMWVSMVFIVG